MLPAVLTSKFTKTAIAATLTLGIAASLAAPAQAFGRNERKFLQGAAAAIVIDRILDDMRRNPQPRAYYPRQPEPGRTYYVPPNLSPNYYVPPARDYGPHTYRPGIYDTPVARAFNSYGYGERRRIQQRLAAYGYYHSGIDGAFGPGTHAAITAYANDTGAGRNLGTQAGAFGLLDGLIY
ncbi:MAG: peptidoglycan-binding protein [Gemmobacter sp.]|jgi:hypothetical protein|nr:peptidoglycan-binding protein [Gemmobacter sp.]